MHCHAGLGRTGLIIASFLVYKGYSVNDAIQTVRLHRPTAIQTTKQEEFITNFYHYIRELQTVFAIPKQHQKFTFEKAVKRQRRYLHGTEEQVIRFIPKIIYVITQRLTELHNIITNEGTTNSIDYVVDSRLIDAKGNRDKLNIMKFNANQDKWNLIHTDYNIYLLFILLFEWFEHLKEPVIPMSTITPLLDNNNNNNNNTNNSNSNNNSLFFLDQLSKPLICTIELLLKVLKMVFIF